MSCRGSLAGFSRSWYDNLIVRSRNDTAEENPRVRKREIRSSPGGFE